MTGGSARRADSSLSDFVEGEAGRLLQRVDKAALDAAIDPTTGRTVAPPLGNVAADSN